MTIIRISDFETLDVEAIRSYKSSEREMPKDPDGNVAARETVLTITKYDGEDVTLSGALAEAALSILRQHGC